MTKEKEDTQYELAKEFWYKNPKFLKKVSTFMEKNVYDQEAITIVTLVAEKMGIMGFKGRYLKYL